MAAISSRVIKELLSLQRRVLLSYSRLVFQLLFIHLPWLFCFFFSHSAAASPFLYNFLTYPIFSASIQLKLFSSFPPGYLEPDFTCEVTETRTPAMPKRHEQWWTQEYAPKQAATCPYIQDRALTQEATRIRLNPEHIQRTETVHSNNSCTIKFIVFKNLTACSNWKKFL